MVVGVTEYVTISVIELELKRTSLMVVELLKVVVSPFTWEFAIADQVKLLGGFTPNAKFTLLPEHMVPDVEVKIGSETTVIEISCMGPWQLEMDVGVTLYVTVWKPVVEFTSASPIVEDVELDVVSPDTFGLLIADQL
jgi:hypothetical protein